ncbi:MAG: NADH-quinone oxidoreductase subunit NuoE [Terriglobia bacterium]|jgi:NADH-quinone oxidoreductase subunit E
MATTLKEYDMASCQQPAATLLPQDLSLVDGILRQFPKVSSSDVIPLLQAIQQRCGYLPREVLEAIAKRTRVSLTRIYGVATFYERFRFQPAGKHVIQACHGTACHVNGAKQTGRAIHQTLQIKDRETTADGLFTLETVACLGCCSLAPVMMIDDKVYGRLNPQRAQRILSSYRRGGGQ